MTTVLFMQIAGVLPGWMVTVPLIIVSALWIWTLTIEEDVEPDDQADDQPYDWKKGGL